MEVRLRVNPIAWADRRTLEQLRHSDSVQVKRWKIAVAKNKKERRRVCKI